MFFYGKYSFVLASSKTPYKFANRLIIYRSIFNICILFSDKQTMMAPSKSPTNSPNFLITGVDETDNFSGLNAGEITRYISFNANSNFIIFVTGTVKSQCSSLSDGESYECFGENVDPNSEGVELVLGPHNSTMIGYELIIFKIL